MRETDAESDGDANVDANADANAYTVSQVGLHLTDSCVPAVKDNTMDGCFFRFIFILPLSSIVEDHISHQGKVQKEEKS